MILRRAHVSALLWLGLVALPFAGHAACGTLANGVVAFPRQDSSGDLYTILSTPTTQVTLSADEGAFAYDTTNDVIKVCDGTSWNTISTGSGSAATDRISSSGNQAMVLAMPGGTVSFTTGSVAGTSYLDSTGRWIGPGISITTANGISSTNGYFSGNVGIGTITPTSKLVVNDDARDVLTVNGNPAAFSYNMTIDAGAATNKGGLLLSNLGAGIPGFLMSSAGGGTFGISGFDQANISLAAVNKGLAIGVNNNAYAAGMVNAITFSSYNLPAAINTIDIQGHSGQTGALLRARDSNGTERFRVNAVGTVGIGIVTPTATLQVSGSFIVSTSAQNTTPTLYANTSGNVGVGTSAPATRLDVQGGMVRVGAGFSGGITGDLSAGRDTSGYIYLGSGGSYLGYNGSNFLLNGGGLTVATGNVGIGTTTPNAKLDVIGTISATALYVTSTAGVVSATIVYGNVASFTTLTVGGVAVAGGSGGSADRISSSGNQAMVLAMPGGTVSFTTGSVAGTSYLDSTGRWIGPGISITTANGISSTNGYFSGNVGIGTTTPGENLTIASVTSYNSGLKLTGNTALGVGLAVENTQASGRKFSLFSTGSSTGPGVGSFAIVDDTSAAYRLIIDPSGQFGIGVVVPTAKLHVSSAAASTAAFKISDAVNYVLKAGYVASGVGFFGGDTGSAMALYANNAEAVRIATSGNVGIGTTAPTATLQVSGSFIVSTTGQTTTPTLYANTSGNVGIGTTAPTNNLHVNGTSRFEDYLYGQSATGKLYINSDIALSTTKKLYLDGGSNTYISEISSDNLNFVTAGSEAMRIAATGNVGIGTTAPDEGRLEVKGGAVCVDTNNDGSATNCIANESDARLKKNVRPLAGSLNKVMALRGVTFDWKTDDAEVLKHYPLIARFAAKPHSVGFIAQEVQKVVPEAIEQETLGDKEVQYLQLDYTKLIPVMVEAIKELKAENNSLRALVREQGQAIDKLRGKRKASGKP